MTAKRKPLLLGPDAAHKAAALDKAALDAANELDCLSGHLREQLDGVSLANIKAIVERVYDASEQLQPLIEVKP